MCLFVSTCKAEHVFSLTHSPTTPPLTSVRPLTLTHRQWGRVISARHWLTSFVCAGQLQQDSCIWPVCPPHPPPSPPLPLVREDQMTPPSPPPPLSVPRAPLGWEMVWRATNSEQASVCSRWTGLSPPRCLITLCC